MTFPVFAGSNPSGYNLTRSLRFRASASAYLNRTPATTTNQKTWTWSMWVKRGALSTQQAIFDIASGSAGVPRGGFYFETDNTLNFLFNTSGSSFNVQLVTTQVFRDPSAWYHIVFSVDTTQATAANRIKVYVNGTQVTAFSTATYPAQNTDFPVNSNVLHNIGKLANNVSYFDGYLTEVNFIDGQALTPSSFGSTNTLTGVWQPARYTGTYGTNGFYLPFTDNSVLTTSSNVGLGKDFSGNGNYWTTNNISITSGTTYDSMTDVPTLTSATAANFAVLNPLDKGTVTVDSANLRVVFASASSNYVRGTIGVTSGKWYFEATIANGGSGSASSILGIATASAVITGVFTANASQWGYLFNGTKGTNSVYTAYGATFTNGDVIGIAYDIDNLTLTFYKNGVTQGTAFTGLPSGQIYFPAVSTNDATINANFGQRPFSYTPPTGYVALNTYNLPTSTIVKGNTVMDATIWTGDGSSPRSITNAAGFKPDLVWAKNRSTSGYWNVLFDSVRGAGNQLSSNETDAELASASNVAGKVSAFNSNGFSLATGSSSIRSVNGNTETYVGWQWQAGQGTTSSNTSGTITSTVSVNASAGFSVVTYTTPATNTFTVGHGLGVAPSLIFVKGRNQAYNWDVYHASLGATGRLILNTTSAFVTTSGPWANTAPTSTVFSSSGNGVYYNTGDTLVAYCWATIAGYSAFGSYTGNGSADGPFIYTGFRPKFVMIKYASSAEHWYMLDSSRDPYNQGTNFLMADLSNAEASGVNYDFVSNGFKLRNSGGYDNASGGTYIYACFAENPFKNALAR